ncbi:hypothetical protein JCGZ_01660 [Jatropha curcas]|uniref:Uncharacterized protein n=1 Tax=Jatropha curcas TaxID=180498 RepID=A0A067JJG0_JATCU|nr:hypothetical protein JCGZ_01660 [Jatropha curcas]
MKERMSTLKIEGTLGDFGRVEVEETNKENEETKPRSEPETEKLEFSDEEELEEDKELELGSRKALEKSLGQKDRESEMADVEIHLIEQHSNELTITIKYGKATMENTQSLVDSMERMKSLNDR